MTTPDDGIIDRLYAARSAGNNEAALALCTPDAVFWHNFDGKAETVAEARLSWPALNTAFAAIRLEDVRRLHAPDGLVVSRHLFVGVRHTGETLAWPVCLFVTLRDGLIARMDEYIDRAGVFRLEPGTTTPGL